MGRYEVSFWFWHCHIVTICGKTWLAVAVAKPSVHMALPGVRASGTPFPCHSHPVFLPCFFPKSLGTFSPGFASRRGYRWYLQFILRTSRFQGPGPLRSGLKEALLFCFIPWTSWSCCHKHESSYRSSGIYDVVRTAPNTACGSQDQLFPHPGKLRLGGAK